MTSSLVTVLKFIMAALGAAVFLEFWARRYWKKKYKIPIHDPSKTLYAVYPQLRSIDRNRPTSDDANLNILILGGSALAKDFSPVESYLGEMLVMKGYRQVKIFNFSAAGHTSLDSLLKYRALPDDCHFDLVIVYPGGGEVRVNNVPPHLYRHNYDHVGHYQVTNYLARQHGKARFSLSYTPGVMYYRLLQKLARRRYVPFGRPRKEWLVYGTTRNSVAVFRKNLEGLVAHAEKRGEKLLVMTYAYCYDSRYSDEKFGEKALDYLLHLYPLNIFGAHENVIGTIAEHNGVVRQVAARNPALCFIDQERLLADQYELFNDPFHFSVVGSMRFVDNLLPHVLTIIGGDGRAGGGAAARS